MPKASTLLDINVRVAISKRFIEDKKVKSVLLGRHDWNSSRLSFEGTTVGRKTVGRQVIYDVILNEVPNKVLVLKETCLKYLGPVTSVSEAGNSMETMNEDNFGENTLDDALETSSDDDAEVDLTPGDGWSNVELYVDSRLCSESYQQTRSRLNMNGQQFASPLDYFLFFLPEQQLREIMGNTNFYARQVDPSWRDVTFSEYIMWLALLTVMVVVRHSDRKAYWHQGSSHFTLNVDFTQYMSFNRFNQIMRVHTLEIPKVEKLNADPLYQIRATINAFNNHMASCVVPGKYLVIDESMNQWLGVGMPNIKKVPRKPHPIGQEFKTLCDHHSCCILRMDTVSNPLAKEYDNDPGMKKLTATVKRLVKPWFGSGRTVIADS